jgi:glycosyltransferase involved in cell wall biosynthesis
MPKLLIASTIELFVRSFLLPYGEHFRALGWQVDALAQGVRTSAACRAAFDHVHEANWQRNPFDPRNLQAVAQVRALVQREGYDLVHVHTPVAALVVRYALRDLPVPVIYTAHGFHFHAGGAWLKNTLFLALEKLASSWTDWLIVINREDEGAALRHRLVPAERLRYMPGIGVDTARYDPSHVPENEVARVRAELGVPADAPLFLMIAEFNPGKRHADLLNAFAKIDPRTHLALAGEGPLLDDLRADSTDLIGRVHFLGYRRDIPALIRSANAVVLPSEREGLPRSIMESLCLETPVIGTDIRGVRDLLANESRVLVNVGDVDALARALTWIIERPEDAQVLGRAGRVRMMDYDIRRVIALHEALYAQAMGIQKG